jgi:hypothetical protein
VHDGQSLWASLILDFNDEWKVTSITTADPSAVDIDGARDDVLYRLVAWVEDAGKKVSVAVVFDRGAAEEFLSAAAAEKGKVLSQLAAAGRVSTRS